MKKCSILRFFGNYPSTHNSSLQASCKLNIIHVKLLSISTIPLCMLATQYYVFYVTNSELN